MLTNLSERKFLRDFFIMFLPGDPKSPFLQVQTSAGKVGLQAVGRVALVGAGREDHLVADKARTDVGSPAGRARRELPAYAFALL